MPESGKKRSRDRSRERGSRADRSRDRDRDRSRRRDRDRSRDRDRNRRDRDRNRTEGTTLSRKYEKIAGKKRKTPSSLWGASDNDSDDSADSLSDDSSSNGSGSDEDSDSDSGDSGHQKKKKHRKKKDKIKKSKKKKKKKKKQKKKRKKDSGVNKKLEEAKALLAAAGVDASSLDHGKTPRGRDAIDENDYFNKSTEFRVWLARAKGKYLDEMKSDKAKKMFSKFTVKWNLDQLEDMYYDGIDATTLQAASRTRHKWGFVKNITKEERHSLATTRDSVDTATFHKTLEGTKLTKSDIRDLESDIKQRFGSSSSSSHEKLKAEARKRIDESAADRTMRRERERSELKYQRKKFQQHQRMVEEELVPKKEGHEARREKRRQKGAYARTKDPDDYTMNDSDLMGESGQTEYQRMLAVRSAYKEKREQQRQERANELRQKEADRMKSFLNSMGLQDKFNM